MVIDPLENHNASSRDVSGDFVDIKGERFYAIRNVDKMPPFFVSVVSDDDHWMFVSSTGGLSAGRVSPDTAIFPYITVDKIHDSANHTGSKTLLRVNTGGVWREWEPFNREHDGEFSVTRNLYKNLLGNKLCFEEFNDDLQLAFRYSWVSSDTHGFARQCELQNLSDRRVSLELLDGLQNILPAGTPRFAQTNTSNLVDAYKWTELDKQTGLAYLTLYSGITDRAEPCESLKANTAFCLGIDESTVLISSEQLNKFRRGHALQPEDQRGGMRGAYFVGTTITLDAEASHKWQIVVNCEQSQSQVVDLLEQLAEPANVADAIEQSVDRGSDKLARIMGTADGFQTTAEENVGVHHYANVLFNVLRGGIFDDQYNVSSWDFACTVGQFNKAVFERNKDLFASLADKIDFPELLRIVEDAGDPQLLRLCREYLPIRFGRRHGDPSRPWNLFAIRLKDDHGNRLLSYEGNWRDIFQNWEALAFSYPEFVENMIAKFVNASTMDGYNPYRITKDGIDWEVEEPDDPWSYIGYWGDHQIIYLQKLLELSNSFHPSRLEQLLFEPTFCYANVPYRIKPFAEILKSPKSTVDFDEDLALRIEERVESMGADGKLVLDNSGNVYQVTLLEKLLVPLLSKLANLTIGGGIWMNTQRPEWNDANNALVGQGLSMVTLYYLRRYITFVQKLVSTNTRSIGLSTEVAQWLTTTAAALANIRSMLGDEPISDAQRFAALAALGEAASRYRAAVYENESFSGNDHRSLDEITTMLDDALVAIDHSIQSNRGDDGLYQAYNLLDIRNSELGIDRLYPMLEGQVAALSTGACQPDDAADVVEALFESAVYRPGQDSFMLYPDRQLPDFLDKNRIDSARVESSPFLQRLLREGNSDIVVRDARGTYRFNADFANVGGLNAMLNRMEPHYGDDLRQATPALQALFEEVFDHKSFTGRSGGMFGFEGLGSIYWHMVSKLLLAVQENFFLAVEGGSNEQARRRLADLYYRVRKGIGFNKTPLEYGAFPTDPYSHTPKHAGARQPGMTGQVKEEILTRFGELGIRVSGGSVEFVPALLREREFVDAATEFQYLDVDDEWHTLTVPAAGLAFTWCQIPMLYQLGDAASLRITWDDGNTQTLSTLNLPAEQSAEVFMRSGRIRRLDVTLEKSQLLGD